MMWIIKNKTNNQINKIPLKISNNYHSDSNAVWDISLSLISSDKKLISFMDRQGINGFRKICNSLLYIVNHQMKNQIFFSSK